LTTFQVRSEDFDPKSQTLDKEHWKDLNADNIQRYPTTWVCMLMIVVVLAVACICVPNNNADKPIIAFEDIIYKEFRDQYLHKHQQWHEIQQIDRWYSKIAQTKRDMKMDGDDFASGSQLFGAPHQSPSSSPRGGRKSIGEGVRKTRKQSKYYCLLSVNLFKTYLKNDHTVLSVFQRSDGTNFSTKQRIGLFLLYMYCIMMADAIFYGRQNERPPMGELTASALISLIGTAPVYLIRVLFQWSKPRVVPSSKSRANSWHDALLDDPANKEVADTPASILTDTEANKKAEGDNNATNPSKALTPSMSPIAVDGLNTEMTTMPPLTPADTANEEYKEDAGESDEEMKDEEYLRKTGQIHDTNTKKRLSNTYWSAIKELKKSSRPDMRLVRKCMHYVNTKANAAEKASLASEIRLILFNYNYPFPHWFKRMAWIILVILCVLCVILSVTYGIQFDINAENLRVEKENYEALKNQVQEIEDEQCYNLSLSLNIKHQVLEQQIIEIQNSGDDISELDQAYADDFAGIDNDSTKWLLNILISFLFSVFMWQPLTIYILTWVKIWAFHNGLIMEASVYNMLALLCCCCKSCSKKKKDFDKNRKMMEYKKSLDDEMIGAQGTADFGHIGTNQTNIAYVPEDSERYELSVSGSGFAAVGNEDRALDIIGFLCNDDLFVELPDDFESSYTH